MKNNKLSIAILTHYYNNYNYGGVFQSYALCNALNKFINLCAEQICYSWQIDEKRVDDIKSKSSISILSEKITNLLRRIIRLVYKKSLINIDNKKRESFYSFINKTIPNSGKTFVLDSIKNTLSIYDAFITGSDQVWNTDWYTPVFFLDFVPSDKIKLSYAASISKDGLTEKERAIFKKSLADFKAVSVREEQAVELIKDLSPVEPQVVLDPTLLLDHSDWDKVCAPRVVEGDYIFCYFLGNNPQERNIAKKYAKRKGLKLVSVPLTGVKVYSDLKFGDVILPTASPEEFISLIKHASYVFTDSFHAVVFSHIYQRQFFVFNRDKKGTMNSRIFNITNLLNAQDRFCNGKERETLKYIQSLNDIDYSIPNIKLDEMKEISIKFLKDNIAG